MTEDWSSVFMQALQNSIAQAKAEQKWNQELDFKNRQLAEDARQYNETSKYNYAIFDESKATNRANWLSKYAPAPTNWDTNFGQYFGAAVQNPYGGGGYYVPYTSLENVQRAREEDQKRADFYRTNYSNVEPSKTGYAIPDSMLNIGMLDSANLASPLSKALETNFPTGNLYLNSANSSAKELAGRMKIADDANATQLAGIYANIAAQERMRKDAKTGAYKAYDPKSKKTVLIQNTNPDELTKQGYTYYVPADANEVFNTNRYNELVNNSKPIKDMTPQELSNYVNYLQGEGIDISYVPSVQNAISNRGNQLGREIYGRSNPSNLWGDIMDISLLTTVATHPIAAYNAITNGENFFRQYIDPSSSSNKMWNNTKSSLGGTTDYEDWIYNTQDPDVIKLWEASKAVKRQQTTGASPKDVLNGRSIF